MCELKKNGKVFTSKFVGTGPSSYEKRIYRAAVSQRLRNTDLDGSVHDLTELLCCIEGRTIAVFLFVTQQIHCVIKNALFI